MKWKRKRKKKKLFLILKNYKCENMKKLESKSTTLEPYLLIKNLHIKIYLTTYNTYRAELKRKDGEKFVGYGGYPLEALESLLFCMKFRRNWILINEQLIYNEWE